MLLKGMFWEKKNQKNKTENEAIGLLISLLLSYRAGCGRTGKWPYFLTVITSTRRVCSILHITYSVGQNK